MAAHRVFNAVCFWCLYFFVRSSKSEPEFCFDNKFVNKHVWLNNAEVDHIPLTAIKKRFNECKSCLSKGRSRHSFIVTKDQDYLKEQLIEAYNNADKIVDAKGTFTIAESINLDDLQNIGVIDFKISYKKKHKEFQIRPGKCKYSKEGRFDLGALNNSMEEYKINHLANVNLTDPTDCISNPLATTTEQQQPPHSCGEKMEKSKSQKEHEILKKREYNRK